MNRLPLLALTGMLAGATTLGVMQKPAPADAATYFSVGVRAPGVGVTVGKYPGYYPGYYDGAPGPYAWHRRWAPPYAYAPYPYGPYAYGPYPYAWAPRPGWGHPVVSGRWGRRRR